MSRRPTDFDRIRTASEPSPRRAARARLFSEPVSGEPSAPEEVDADDRPAAAGLPSDISAGSGLTDAVEAGTAGLADADLADPAPSDESGWFAIDCSACGQRSRVGLLGIVRASVPSLHLPLLRREYPSLMRCPHCRTHRWVELTISPR